MSSARRALRSCSALAESPASSAASISAVHITVYKHGRGFDSVVKPFEGTPDQRVLQLPQLAFDMPTAHNCAHAQPVLQAKTSHLKATALLNVNKKAT
jgi:hypothetical protein